MSFAVLSQKFRRATVPLLGAIIILSGCSKTASKEEIRILGKPPATAFLGVEYYYDFGVAGGDGLLNYSLTNAPRWLTAELVNNHARKGVVIRGVPGVTGGGAGRADLEKPTNSEIVLTVYDGDATASITFTIETEENTVQAGNITVVEGQADEPPKSGNGEQASCLVEPQLPEGTDTSRLTPVYVPVELGQPSVQDISVRFRTSELAQASAVQGDAPGDGVDFLAHEGVLEFPAGTTACYVKVWVVNDTRAEDTETFSFLLESVEKGLAKLGAGNSANGNATITIEDDEPIASFELTEMVVSEGGSIEVKAKLDRAPETRVTAEFKVFRDARFPDSSSTLENGYVIDVPKDDEVYQLVFDPETLAGAEPVQSFQVRIDSGLERTSASDRRLVLEWARSETARESNERLQIFVNQWTQPLIADLGAGGQAVDMLADRNSRVLLGFNSLDTASGQMRGWVAFYDRFGASIVDLVPFADAGLAELEHRLTGMTMQEYDVVVEADRTDHYLDLYLVGTTQGNTAGQGSGGKDILLEKWRKVNDQAFALVWARQLGSTQDDLPHAVQLDTNGNIFVVGETQGAIGGSTSQGQTDAFIAKFDSAGQLLLATNIGSSGNDAFVAAAGNGQNLEVAGYSDAKYEEVHMGGKDVIVASYNREAQIRRAEQFGNVFDNQATSMALLGNDLAVGGHTQGSLMDKTARGGQDAFLAYMQSASSVDDLIQFGSAGDDAVLDLTTWNQSIFVTGYVGAAMVSDVLLGEKGPWGGRDAFVGRVDLLTEGEGTSRKTWLEPVWFRQLGSAGDERGVGLAYTASHKLMLATELEGETTLVRIEPFDARGESLIISGN